MKEKEQNRKPILITLLVIAGVILIGLTAAAVYAGRIISNELGSAFSQIPSLATEPLAQEIESQDSGSIFDKGVLVTRVTPDSPAQLAGIRRGTIILKVDGQEVSSLAELTDALSSKGGGASVSLTILNSSEPETVTVTLADTPPLLGVQIAEANGGRNFGRFPDGMDLSQIPDGFQFDPDDLPLNPEDFGLPEDFNFQHGMMAGGVMVAKVIAGSSAEQAGLLTGDVITAIDGEEVTSVDKLVEKIGAMKPGDSTTLSIKRDGEAEDIQVTLGENPENSEIGFLGIQPAPAMSALRSGKGRGDFDPSQIPFTGGFHTGAAVIVEVVDGSPAAKAGLEKGDIITAVDGTMIATVDELIELVRSTSAGDTITLTFNRDDQELEEEVTLAANPDDDSKAYLGVHLGAFFNVDVEKFGEGKGVLPQEFFYRLHPNAEPGDRFDFSEGFEIPDALEDLMPDLAPSTTPQDPGEQNA